MKYVPPYGAPGDDDPYVNGDPSIARQGSIIPAGAVEYPQREIVSMIERNNFTADDGSLEQLTASARSQFVNFCFDTGSINNLSVALDPPLTAYRQGLPLRVLIGNNNTGACVININSLGGRPIRRPNGSELLPNDLVAGMVASIVDDGNAFQLQNFQAGGGGGGGEPGEDVINNWMVKIPYAEDKSDTINLIIADFLPVITSVAAGDVIIVKLKNQNSGPVEIKINGLPNAPVRRNDGKPLEHRDILAGEAIILEYNTTYWQMLRLVRSQVWFKLTADLTVFVRPDGNDDNDGSANDPQHAFRTIMRAVRHVQQSFAIAGRTVTIQLGIPGTYQGSVTVDNLPGFVIIRGDPNNMDAYDVLGDPYVPGQFTDVLKTRAAGTNVVLEGVTLNNQSPKHNVIDVEFGSRLHIQNCSFKGVTTSSWVIAVQNADCSLSDYIHNWVHCRGMFYCNGGSIITGNWFTLVNIHGMRWSYAFIHMIYGYIQLQYGHLQFTGNTYNGTKWCIYLNSVVNTNGAPKDYVPGCCFGGDESSVHSEFAMPPGFIRLEGIQRERE